MAVLWHNVPISQSSSSKQTSTVMSVAQFGNGYEHRVPMGRNFKRDKLNYSHTAISGAELTTLTGWISAMQTGDITSHATPFDGATAVAKLWVLDGEPNVANSSIGGDNWDYSYSLRQVFQS